MKVSSRCQVCRMAYYSISSLTAFRSARNYVEGLPNAQQLLDLLSAVSEPMDIVTSTRRDVIYPEVSSIYLQAVMELHCAF